MALTCTTGWFAGAFWAPLPAALVGSVHAGIALGAVGAASSVLLRISSSKVDLDVESTRHGWYPWADPVIQRGMFRVAMGSIFGGMAAWWVNRNGPVL